MDMRGKAKTDNKPLNAKSKETSILTQLQKAIRRLFGHERNAENHANGAITIVS